MMSFDWVQPSVIHNEPMIDHHEMLPPERFRSFLSRKRCVIQVDDFVVERSLNVNPVITEVEASNDKLISDSSTQTVDERVEIPVVNRQVICLKQFSSSATQTIDESEESLCEDNNDSLRKCYMIASDDIEDEAEHSLGLSLDGDMPDDLTYNEVMSSEVTPVTSQNNVAAKKPLSRSTGLEEPTHSLATGECRSDRKNRVAVESKPRGGDKAVAGNTTSWGRHGAGIVADVVATTASGHFHHIGTRSGVAI